MLKTNKYSKGMSFEQFLYVNYGFSYTQAQKNRAFNEWWAKSNELC